MTWVDGCRRIKAICLRFGFLSAAAFMTLSAIGPHTLALKTLRANQEDKQETKLKNRWLHARCVLGTILMMFRKLARNRFPMLMYGGCFPSMIDQ